MPNEGQPRAYRFGVFEVTPRAGELRKHGIRLRLQDQPFQVLLLLLGKPGEVVTREELMKALWPSDTFVDFEHGLNKAINKLRDALGDSIASPRYIETLPKRGYRFVAPVDRIEEATPLARAPADAQALGSAASASATGVSPTDARAARGRARRWLWAVVAVTAMAGLFYAWRTRTAPVPAGKSTRVMLAVLPFENLGHDQAQEYFCDGMTEEMILHLSRLSPQRLAVIARSSSMHYRGSTKRADEIARELGGVEYLLSGSVRRVADGVRISAQLVQTRDQTNLWAESYERPLADVFQIQSEVARRIARSLAIELLPAQQAALDRPPTTSAAAYEAYLRGRFYWNLRGEEELKKGLEYFQKAVQMDPQFTLAYTGLADSYNVLSYYGAISAREGFPQSKAAAEKALAMNENSAEALTALAYAKHYYDWDWAEAEKLFRRAAAANPNYAPAHQWFAAQLMALGRMPEAIAEMQHARDVDPQALIIQAGLGWIHYHARDNASALEQLQRTLAREPDFLPAHFWLGQVYEQTKNYAQARAQFRKVIELSGNSPAARGELAYLYALQGQKAQAEALLEDFLRLAKQRYIEPDMIARIYLGLERKDEALTWLEKALEARSATMALIGVDPRYDPVRRTPRFQSLLRRMNLPARPQSSGE